LAMIHMPDLEYWTTNDFEWSGDTIQKLGLNLGAPGDRMEENGTLWLDYPSVGGDSPEIPVTLEKAGEARRILRHSLGIKAGSLPWVSSSALEGVTSLAIQLTTGEEDSLRYDVNLFFSELDSKVVPGDRVFDVEVQGKTIRSRMDIAGEAGGWMKELSVTVPSVEVKDGVLRIALKPLPGSKEAIINGIRIEKVSGNSKTAANFQH